MHATWWHTRWTWYFSIFHKNNYEKSYTVARIIQKISSGVYRMYNMPYLDEYIQGELKLNDFPSQTQSGKHSRNVYTTHLEID